MEKRALSWAVAQGVRCSEMHLISASSLRHRPFCLFHQHVLIFCFYHPLSPRHLTHQAVLDYSGLLYHLKAALPAVLAHILVFHCSIFPFAPILVRGLAVSSEDHQGDILPKQHLGSKLGPPQASAYPVHRQ